MIGVAIGALILAAAALALVFWAAKWARASADRYSASEAAVLELRLRVDELGRDVQDRDRVISDHEAELERERAARAVAARQRDDAQAVIDTLATRDPAAVAAAVRAKLGRLQAFGVEPDDVPGADAGPASTPG